MSPYLFYDSDTSWSKNSELQYKFYAKTWERKSYKWPCVHVHAAPSAGQTDLTGHNCSILVAPIEDLLVVIHPDFGQAHLVASDDLCAFGEGMGALGAEDMAHHRTGDDL